MPYVGYLHIEKFGEVHSTRQIFQNGRYAFVGGVFLLFL